MAELLLDQQRLTELERLLSDLEQSPQATLEVGILRGRLHLARKEFGRAKSIFAGTTERFPRALWPKVFQSHALLQEGKDWVAAEEALRGILKLDPNNPEARRNLQVLLQRHGSVSTN